jgi:putative endonuclease
MTYKQFIGAKGEESAVKLLEDNGFTILKRNYSVHNVGEIDIIAGKAGEIHIVEVRTRLNVGYYPDSVESVAGAKRKRIVRTAEHFIMENDLYDRNIVFEVIRVTHDAKGNIIRIDFVPF